MEIALQYNNGYAETLFSFANNINTVDGGTHLSGFRSALTSVAGTAALTDTPGAAGGATATHRSPDCIRASKARLNPSWST